MLSLNRVGMQEVGKKHFTRFSIRELMLSTQEKEKAGDDFISQPTTQNNDI